MAGTQERPEAQGPDPFAQIAVAQTALPEQFGGGSLSGGVAAAADQWFMWGTMGLAGVAVATLAGLVLLLIVYAGPAITRYGLGFLVSSTWDPVFEQFGAAPFIYGTVVTSLVALLVATPLGVGAA